MPSFILRARTEYCRARVGLRTRAAACDGDRAQSVSFFGLGCVGARHLKGARTGAQRGAGFKYDAVSPLPAASAAGEATTVAKNLVTEQDECLSQRES